MKVAEGTPVAIEYVLKLDGEDEVIDSSSPEKPFTFVQGLGQVIPGLERGIEGLDEGQEASLVIPPEDGYGDINPQMVLNVDRAELPTDLEPEPGGSLQMQTQDGAVFTGTVTEVQEASITVDFNHPLAGKTLNFWVKVAHVGNGDSSN